MISVCGPFNTGAAVGADGVATINVDTPYPIRGIIRGVGVKYNGDKPGTADLTIKGKGTNCLTKPILTVTDGNTDKWFFPKELIDTVAGVEVATVYEDIAIDDVVNIKLDQTNTGDTVYVWFLLEK
jgi:hypothetical protein